MRSILLPLPPLPCAEFETTRGLTSPPLSFLPLRIDQEIDEKIQEGLEVAVEEWMKEEVRSLPILKLKEGNTTRRRLRADRVPLAPFDLRWVPEEIRRRSRALDQLLNSLL